MAKKGKKYTQALAKIDRTKLYDAHRSFKFSCRNSYS